MVNFDIDYKYSLFWNVFFTVTFQVRTFSHTVNVFTENYLFYVTETHICWFKAFYTIAHIIHNVIIKDKVIVNYSLYLIKNLKKYYTIVCFL